MQNVIEALEARIAPAAVFTYTEADGDRVTMKTSAKISNADFEAYIHSTAEFDNGDLSVLNLHDPAFRKTDLTITVAKGVGGNGKASIGYINADVDLKNVIIDGDLRAIQVGDLNVGTPALGKLQVRDLGGNNGESNFRGDVKVIKILGDLTGDLYTEGGNFNSINITGAIKDTGELPEISAGRIGSIIIGGNMEGRIDARTIDSVRVGGDLIGVNQNYERSGTISAQTIKSVRIAGDIVGGTQYGTGGIYAYNLASVSVAGNVLGGAGDESGFIWGENELGKVIVSGNVTGGSGDNSGRVGGYGSIGSLFIGKDLKGGAGNHSGWIGSNEGGTVDRIVVGGSIVGTGDDSGRVESNLIGSIRVGGDLKGGDGQASGGVFAWGIGSANIGGSILGGVGPGSGSVDAGGIGSIRVGKDVTGGTGEGSGSISGYYGIDSVKIGGNVVGDASRSGSIGSEDGSIESITIGGSLSNTGNGMTGIYAACSIGRVTIAGDVEGANYGTLGIRAANWRSSNLSVPTIGSVDIKGDVANFLVEAGVDLGGSVSAGATLGTVNIRGDFTTSSIAASVNAGDDHFYGTADDVLPSADPSVISRIASMVIGGTVSGTPSAVSDADGYGIFAQHIAAVKIGSVKQVLTTGASKDTTAKFLGTTGDVRLVELPVSSEV